MRDQLLDALKLSPERVRELAAAADGASSSRVSRAPAYLGPVNDGRSLPRDPFDPDAPPLSAAIPMMLGNTKGETRTLIGRGDPSLFDLTWDTLQAEARGELAVHGTLDRGRGDRRATGAWHPALLAGRRLLRRDDGLAIVARPGHRGGSPRRAAEAARRRTWVYQFDWRNARSTAAAGARITASTCRSYSTTTRIVPGQGRAPMTGAHRLAARMSAALARVRDDAATRIPRGLPRWPVYDLPRRADDGVRRAHPGRRRSARRRAPAVRTGPVCSAGNVEALCAVVLAMRRSPPCAVGQ